MEFYIRNDQKLAEIWLTKQEKQYADLRRRLEPFYAEYNKTDYTIVTFLSGQEPLYGLTRDLLVSSRKRQAAAEVRQEKHEHSQKG